MTFADHIPDAEALFDEILASCSNPDSQLHGPTHWAHVAKTGHILLEREKKGDPVVVFLFALFHDCNRLNDNTDPDHGLRSGLLALNFWRRKGKDKLFNISVQQMIWLYAACHFHTESPATADLTLGVCFDADRLNLMRVGIFPDTEFLSTDTAHDAAVIDQMSDEVWDEPPSWKDLAERYASL